MAEKIAFVFNKFYTCLIKDVKKNTSDAIKESVRKHYKAIDKMSDEHVKFFLESFGGSFPEEPPNDRAVLRDLTLGQLLEATEGEGDREVLLNYYYVLSALALVYNEYETCEDDEDSVGVLAHSVLEVLGKVQKGGAADEEIGAILHDEVQALLRKVKFVNLDPAGAGVGADAPPENAFANMFKGMENSKICNLAQEISKDIDTANLKLDSQEDIMKLLDFSSSNNIMGDIIKKVSSKMQEKLSSGELKQDELLGEAMSMMGSMGGGMGGLGGLFNNPMMSEMMKMAKQGKAKPKPDAFRSASSRDRLRKKLDERRRKASGDAP